MQSMVFEKFLHHSKYCFYFQENPHKKLLIQMKIKFGKYDRFTKSCKWGKIEKPKQVNNRTVFLFLKKGRLRIGYTYHLVK